MSLDIPTPVIPAPITPPITLVAPVVVVPAPVAIPDPPVVAITEPVAPGPVALPPVTAAQENNATQLGADLLNGKLNIAGAVVGKIRTLVPLILGPVLAWLVFQFPTVAHFLDANAVGWQNIIFGGVSAALGFGYWLLARWLGRQKWFGWNWARVETVMLGSAVQPVYLAPTK